MGGPFCRLTPIYPRPSVRADTKRESRSPIAGGLTLANSQTIIAFVGIFAGAGLAVSGGGWETPAITVAGVFAGSFGWWLVLVTVSGALRERVGQRVLLWVTRVSGAAIAVLGVSAMRVGVGAVIG